MIQPFIIMSRMLIVHRTFLMITTGIVKDAIYNIVLVTPNRVLLFDSYAPVDVLFSGLLFSTGRGLSFLVNLLLFWFYHKKEYRSHFCERIL